MMAENNTTSPVNCSIDERIANLAIPVLYFLLFFPGLLLNVLAACVSLKLPERSTFTVYLKNLIAADLLMTLCIPIKAASGLQDAHMGLREFACRYSTVLFYMSMYISILLMGLISLDRFFKIVMSPRRFFLQNLTFSRALSTSVWVIMFCSMALPTMILTNKKAASTGSEYCATQKSESGRKLHKAVTAACLVLFSIVSTLILVCYICITKRVLQSYRDSKSSNENVPQKTKARVFIILAVFLICFVPYHVTRIPYTLIQTDVCKKAAFRVAKELLLWLSSTNVCLDPLIYIFLSKSFRERLIEMGICRRAFHMLDQSNNEMTSL